MKCEIYRQTMNERSGFTEKYAAKDNVFLSIEANTSPPRLVDKPIKTIINPFTHVRARTGTPGISDARPTHSLSRPVFQTGKQL